jgi:cell division transport system permease protein
MKSLKNHLSLIIALATVLFTVQIFMIVDRSLESYEDRLKNDYSVIIVAKTEIDAKAIADIDSLIDSSEPISPERIINQLREDMHNKNLELLKLSLPKFYRIHLKHFPTPKEISRLSGNLFKHPLITRVENFAENHDMVYKLLLLFKKVVSVFAIAVFAVTALLILKELRIWQFQHSERMNIMALFGAPVWLRSAVLYRLAIVDAVVAAIMVNIAFYVTMKNGWVDAQLNAVGISVDMYRLSPDGLILATLALGISLVLATMIVMGHREEA